MKQNSTYLHIPGSAADYNRGVMKGLLEKKNSKFPTITSNKSSKDSLLKTAKCVDNTTFSKTFKPAPTIFPFIPSKFFTNFLKYDIIYRFRIKICIFY